MFLLLIFLLKCLIVANARQIECESFQSRKDDSGKVVEVCRIDQSTSINSFNVTFASEFDDAKNNDKIRYLPKNIYEKFPNLKTLNFEECSLKAVVKENLQKLFFLKRIDFSYNEIRTVNDGTFNDLAKLEQLILSYNKISRMNGDVFKPLVKLRLLDFDGNFCITEKFFDNLNMTKIVEKVSQQCLVYENNQICQKDLKVSERIKNNCTCTKSDDSGIGVSGGAIFGANDSEVIRITLGKYYLFLFNH
jgi:Leucine rich repeat